MLYIRMADAMKECTAAVGMISTAVSQNHNHFYIARQEDKQQWQKVIKNLSGYTNMI